MARGKQASRSSIAAKNKRDLRRLSTTVSNDGPTTSTPRGFLSQEDIKASIQDHWAKFCPTLQSFITANPQHVNFKTLMNFWSLAENSPYAAMNVGPGTVHMLAYSYLFLGETFIAQALIRCGAFLNQLNKGTVPMSKIASMSEEDTANAKKLPIYAYAIKSISEGKEKNYLKQAIPLKYMKALGLGGSSSK